MTTSMYCLYVWFDYTYIYINALTYRIWPYKFGFKPLQGLEPMTPIRPQLLVSHANHSVTETSLYVCIYVCLYVCMLACMYVCMFVYVCMYACLYVCVEVSLVIPFLYTTCESVLHSTIALASIIRVVCIF